MNSKDIYNQQMAALKEEQDRLDKLRKQEEKRRSKKIIMTVGEFEDKLEEAMSEY